MQTDADELLLAWRGLSAGDTGDGLRVIALGADRLRVRAGITYPLGQETLLVGFNLGQTRRVDELPEARGFSVSFLAEPPAARYENWIALTRRPEAGVDLFALMASDIAASLTDAGPASEQWLFGTLLHRIRAWQDFMQRPRDGVLSREKELGLFGELLVFRDFLDAGVTPVQVAAAWQGPARSVQDFIVGYRGLEVKTTLSANGFPARISSLDQLDTSQGRAVMVAAVRLSLQDDGLTLPELVTDLRERLAGIGLTASLFERSLLLAGYFDTAADKYVRRFGPVNTRVFPVDDDFPSLTRSAVRAEIRTAEYELDLDLVTAPAIALGEVITQHRLF
ncbi:PD-(D/E)XK motif protein [Caulobacter sp. ErkDOM-YI]|uniref:PD-(D/E)XK motif protein n=1 Tax=unclassified Caulobacter TaxID=2648921 RepID=UPI003AF9FCF3